MSDRGTIRLDTREQPKDTVDAIVHDPRCRKMRLVSKGAASWICVDSCALGDRALLTVTAAQMTDLRAAMEDNDGE
jgi:hypothetical protein